MANTRSARKRSTTRHRFPALNPERLESRNLLSASPGSADDLLDTGEPESPANLEVLVSGGFQPLLPEGSLAFSSEFSGSIDVAFVPENQSLSLEAGQQISVSLDGGAAALSSIEIFDPASQPIGTENASVVGERLILNSVPIRTSGVHTIRISDNAGGIGDFSGRVLINSSFEREMVMDNSNDDMLSAENIDGAFVDLSTGTPQRAHVVGSRGADLEEDFESGVFADDFSTASFGTQGRIRITKLSPAASGLNFLLMDRETQLLDTRNEATWTVDLSSFSEATLEFSHARFNDEENRLPDVFTGSVDGDGVAISEDGITWHTILNSPQTENFEWFKTTVDLVDLTNSLGINLDADFHIKFQQFDNGPFSSDGRGYDAMSITTVPGTKTEDWYELSLEDGQYLGAAISEFDFSVGAALELYDVNSQLLATSSSSQNANQVIVNFLDTTSDGGSTSYFLRVTDPAENYGLLVTKDVTFDKESNSSFSGAQDISNTQVALGYVDDSAGTSLKLLSNFPGTDFTRFVPADPIVAAGPTHVVAVVNSRLGIYDKATGQQVFTQPMANATGFFGSVGAISTTFDPWILFDEATQRFFLVVIDVETDEIANLYFAVSTSATPTSGADWHKYQLNFAHDPDPLGLGSGLHFADYEKIGVSSDAITVAGNYFPINEGSGVYTGITSFDKQAMVDGDPLNMLYQEFFPGFGVFPLHQYDDTSTQYFVEALDEDDLRVHALTDVATNPVRHTFDVRVPNYGPPSLVPQLGDVRPADVLDARIMSGVLRDQSVWVAHGATDPTIDDETLVRWYQIDTNNFPLNDPILIQSGNVDPGPNLYAFMPAITVDANQNMGIGFSIGGPDIYLSAGFTGRLNSDPAGSTAFPIQEYVTGLAPYENLRNDRNRWGDYSGIAIDPADGRTFWVYNMYASESGTWSTQIGSFQLDPQPDSDWYSIEVNAGDFIAIGTQTPFDGVNEIPNVVDLEIELYDPSEQLLAADSDSAPDGRNAELLHIASTPGTYRIRVIPTSGSGAYQLSTIGSRGDNPAPEAITSSPSDGHVAGQFPETYDVLFSEQIAATSVTGSDLTVNGIPALDARVQGDRIRFTLDPASNTGDGAFAISMAAGSVSDYDGNVTLDPFNATLVVDTEGVSITSTRWNGQTFPADSTFTSGPLVFEAFLTEPPFRSASARRGLFAPGTDDVVLTNTNTGEQVEESSIDVNPITNVFSATYDNLPQGVYELRLVSGPGAFFDEAGNPLDGESNPNSIDGTPTGDGTPGGDYVISFTVDDLSTAANPFTRIEPLGGLSFRSLNNDGFFDNAADIDRFSFFAFAGETVSAVATVGADATANMEIVGLGGTITNPGIGENVVYLPQQIPATGFYELQITGDGEFDYAIDIFRNAVSESFVDDSSLTQVVSASESFVELGSGRFGIVGESTPVFGFDITNDPSKFVDIADTAFITLNLGDDAETTLESQVGNEAIPAGRVTIGNNGGLLEGENINLLFQNLFLPSPDIDVGTALFPYWDDLGASRDHIYADQVMIGGVRTLVVQWEQMPHVDFMDSGDITFQVQVFETGPILARYAYKDVEFGDASVDFGANSTIGYQNIDGRFVQHSLNMPGAVANGDIFDLRIVPDEDVYGIDLSNHVGDVIDIVLKGQANVDYSNETLELLAADGTVLAVAVANPLGVDATNFDLGILGFTVPSAGDYRIRLSSETGGEYGIGITESIVFDAEPNSAGQTLRTVLPFSTALGYLDGGDSEDHFAIDLSAGQMVNLQTRTPFDAPQGSPLNSLDPRIRVLHANGTTVLAADDDSADGKNAWLEFTAPAAGTYLISVGATSGTGEYLLNLEALDLPRLQVSDASVLEGDSGTTTMEFTITRSDNLSDISVDVTTQDGSAIAGQDYQGRQTTVQFSSGGALTKAVKIQVIGDLINEADEHFTLALSNATDATITDGIGTGTIVDDDEDANIAPRVASVRVGSTDWSSPFRGFVDPELQLGYPIPDGADQLASLTWSGIDQIFLQFTEIVTFNQDEVVLLGVNVPNYTPQIASVNFDPITFVASIELASPIDVDRMQLFISDDIVDLSGNFLDGEWENGVSTGPSGDGSAGGSFLYEFNVLPGDFNGSKLVDTNDILAVRDLRFENITTAGYDIRADIDGSGSVDSGDVLATRDRRFTFLPLDPNGVAAAVATGRSADEPLRGLDDDQDDDVLNDATELD